MPEYKGVIHKEKLSFTRGDLLEKWCARNDGLWFKAKLEVIGKSADPKTAEQLGFYWGLLLPEITAELNRQGHTITITFNNFEREIPYTEEAAHELLTALCGHVGVDGAAIRLSEADKYQTINFVTNVLDFAVDTLDMNEARLEAWKTE